MLPLSTAALAAIWLGERPGPAGLLGLLLAAAGIALIAGGALADVDIGALLVVCGVLAYAVYTVLLGRGGANDPVVLAAATCLWGLAFLLPWQLWEAAAGAALLDPTPGLLAAIGYLGVVASGGPAALDLRCLPVAGNRRWCLHRRRPRRRLPARRRRRRATDPAKGHWLHAGHRRGGRRHASRSTTDRPKASPEPKPPVQVLRLTEPGGRSSDVPEDVRPLVVTPVQPGRGLWRVGSIHEHDSPRFA